MRSSKESDRVIDTLKLRETEERLKPDSLSFKSTRIEEPFTLPGRLDHTSVVNRPSLVSSQHSTRITRKEDISEAFSDHNYVGMKPNDSTIKPNSTLTRTGYQDQASRPSWDVKRPNASGKNLQGSVKNQDFVEKPNGVPATHDRPVWKLGKAKESQCETNQKYIGASVALSPVRCATSGTSVLTLKSVSVSPDLAARNLNRNDVTAGDGVRVRSQQDQSFISQSHCNIEMSNTRGGIVPSAAQTKFHSRVVPAQSLNTRTKNWAEYLKNGDVLPSDTDPRLEGVVKQCRLTLDSNDLPTTSLIANCVNRDLSIKDGNKNENIEAENASLNVESLTTITDDRRYLRRSCIPVLTLGGLKKCSIITRDLLDQYETREICERLKLRGDKNAFDAWEDPAPSPPPPPTQFGWVSSPCMSFDPSWTAE